MLEKQFHYKLTIRDIRGGAHQDKLIEAMKSLAVQAEGEMTDIRWGIVFYGLDESRVGALYFDKSGSKEQWATLPPLSKGAYSSGWMGTSQLAFVDLAAILKAAGQSGTCRILT